MLSYVHGPANEGDNPLPLAKLCMKHGASLLFHRHEHKVFPPALARNVGARRVIDRVVCFVDIDIVLHPNTYEMALGYMRRRDAVVYLRPAMMGEGPRSAVFRNLTVEKYERHMKRGGGAPGTGGCVFVPQRILFATHGYDEQFVGYGATDWDFTSRVCPAGFALVDMSKKTGIRAMHQAHSQRSNTNPINQANRNRYARLKGKQTRRNPGGWGGIPAKRYEVK
jgi:hypothetical protein